MTTADAVRRVGLALPRTYERKVRGRWKLKVKQIVFVAFCRDETAMGFGYPKAERDGLIASAPDTFFLPPTADLRYQWVCAHLDARRRGDARAGHRRLADVRAEMLHELPELPAPRRGAWSDRAQEWDDVARCCTPTCAGSTATCPCAGGPGARPPAATRRRGPRPRRVRDGQVYRWSR